MWPANTLGLILHTSSFEQCKFLCKFINVKFSVYPPDNTSHMAVLSLKNNSIGPARLVDPKIN